MGCLFFSVLLFSDIAFPLYSTLSIVPTASHLPLFPFIKPFLRRERGLEKTASSKNGSSWPCVKQHIPYVTPGLILLLIYATAKRLNRRSWNLVNAAARGDFADVFRPSAHSPPFVSPVREDVNVIGAVVSREDSKARIKTARYTTAKTSEAI